MIHLASNIRFIRKKKGLTQAQLALELDYRSSAVSTWETGTIIPSISEIEKIADFLGIEASKLIWADLSDVQVSENPADGENDKNVQGIVRASVQGSIENRVQGTRDQERIKELEKQLEDANKMVDVLSLAVRGLEAANRGLNVDLDKLREQNEAYKKEIPTVHKGMESPVTKKVG